MFTAKQSVEDLGGVAPAPVVMFANGVGVCFKDDDVIANNVAVQNVLKTVSQDDLIKQNGFTNFSLDHRELGYFLHLAFCHAADGNKITVDFDGIYPFQAEDKQGERQLYNAQLITISEQQVIE